MTQKKMITLKHARALGLILFLGTQTPFAESAESYTPDKLFGGYAVKYDEPALLASLANLDLLQLVASAPQERPPYYLDMGETVSNSQIRTLLMAGLIEEAQKTPFDCIAGTPITGKAWAALLAGKMSRPLLTLHQTGSDKKSPFTVRGAIEKGKTCLLVDDVMASGGTLLKSIDALKNEGLLVQKIIVAVDREEGGKERLQHQGYQVHALTKLSKLLTFLEQKGKISEADMKAILDYTKQKRNQN